MLRDAINTAGSLFQCIRVSVRLCAMQIDIYITFIFTFVFRSFSADFLLCFSVVD